MKIKKVLSGAFLFAFLSMQSGIYAGAYAASHETDVADAKGATYENYSTTGNGGAISNGAITSAITDCVFKNNTATNRGGAVYNEGTMVLGGTFEGNSAVHGGAVYNKGIMTIKDGTTFENNFANIEGSAIANYATYLNVGNNVSFKNNQSFLNGYSYAGASEMGALYSEGNASRQNVVIIGNNVLFEGNKSYGGAGLYLFGNNDVTIGDNAKFISNSTHAGYGQEAVGGGGGAIAIVPNNLTPPGGSPSLKIGKNALFKGNIALYGGAINVNDTAAHLEIGDGAQFIENKTIGNVGGAIYTNTSAGTVIGKNSLFKNNSTNTHGGAIYNTAALTIGGGTVFEGNQATMDGGAIYTKAALTLNDVSFIGNKSDRKGGAILASDNLTINAVGQDVKFSGNTAVNGADVYMATAGKTLTLSAAEDRKITFDGGISGDDGKYNIVINSPSDDGEVLFNSEITNAAIEVQKGMLHFTNNASLNASTINVKTGALFNAIDNTISVIPDSVSFENNARIAVDVNFATGKGDDFSKVTIAAPPAVRGGGGSLIIEEVNPLGVESQPGTVNLPKALGLAPEDIQIAPELLSAPQKTLTPLRYYNGSIDAAGNATFGPTGNTYNDFNPAVSANTVASQVGGYLVQLNTYNQAFENYEAYMNMTKQERTVMKLRNKYAISEGALPYDSSKSLYENNNMWFRPYTTFEKVSLKHGPDVSNVLYGGFFGGESSINDLGNGWEGSYGVYAGYNGSHQSYDGISIYQNGAAFGLSGMLAKGNFFTALTTNSGVNFGKSHTNYGADNFTMLMAGIASKTGYNIELARGKFMIQPNYQMSYSYVNTFDYTNSAGVKLDSDGFHVLQLEPGLKIIGNFKNGWQPYIGASVVWNLMGDGNAKANDVALPELSIKPYVKYGVGLKKMGQRAAGFLQAFCMNGGRTGVGFVGGIDWAVGKDISSHVSSGKVAKLPKTKMNLRSAKNEEK